MAEVKKKKTTKKSTKAKKPAATKKAKATKKTTVAKKAAAKVVDKTLAQQKDLKDLDRKGLAAKAHRLKLELLAIRFNVTSPSLKDYRKKRKVLSQVLNALG